MKPYAKTILRSIRQSFGRFLAIMAIIALGVGFMGGLVQTNPSFMYTGRKYINDQKLFDFRLISTIGFSDEDIEKIEALDGVVDAEGAYSADVIARRSGEDESSESMVRIHSITDGVNLLKPEQGRLPEVPGEIAVDGYRFGSEVIGQTLELVAGSGEDDKDDLISDSFTIVGTVRSPIYLDFQRGRTDVGSGQLSYFAYVVPDEFDMEYFTESYVYYDTGFDAYTDEYDDWADIREDELKSSVESIVTDRFNELLDENREDLQKGIEELEDGRIDAVSELEDALTDLEEARDTLGEAREQLDESEQQILSLPFVPDYIQEAYDEALSEYEDGVREYEEGLNDYYEGRREFDAQMTSTSMELEYLTRLIGNEEEPDVYILGRNTNVGYMAFNNDAGIVKGIANVFPLFFFALAALVCSTTMQRMVSDERGIIGTMRALGYSDFSIIMKYVIYSGSAATIGAIAGYYAGLRAFPFVIWDVYRMMYGFSELTLVNSPVLFATALAVSLLCSVGVAFLTAFSELTVMPAELIRPKAPAAGKKIFLEKLPTLWSRLRFTQKVSLRNVFRFKKRMWMMIIGIAGCSALLLTGFGLRDSITNVVDLQYDNITTYRLDAVIKDGVSLSRTQSYVDDINGVLGTSYESIPIRNENVTHVASDMVRDVTLFVSSDPDIGLALRGHVDGQMMPWPGDNEIAISSKLAAKSGLNAGDMITLGYGDDGKTFTVRIAYVFENYVYHYAFMNEYTYEQAYEKTFRPSDLLIVSTGDAVATDYDLARELSNTGDFENVSVVEQARRSFAQTMEQLNVIIVLIIVCAAALAFIVLFNLNNINISERVREIATIKVLGFSRGETGSYFFRENFILVFMGFVLGIPLGIALHRFVIAQIEMDMVTFQVRIANLSYVLSLLFVIMFSVLVDLVMRIKIERINMAESLKSAE
ncbi:MAG: FtsX-like permease family protein [Clostridiales bacterium]|nr:FtsX-like permease family protein [Clostridiales bacterium]